MLDIWNKIMGKTKSKQKESAKEITLMRCPDCPWKSGLRDEKTVCETCQGTGVVEQETVLDE